MVEVKNRVRGHERALFGGFNEESGEREIGVFEQLSEAVTELKRISATLNKSFSYVESFTKSAIAWISRLALLAIGGFFTVLWFIITHWAAIFRAFTDQPK